MPATKAYTRINFENYPSTNTPLNATNLNKVDKGIDDLDDLLVTARNNIETLQSNATTDEANILALQGSVANLNGFIYFPAGEVDLVALVADDSFYTDADGKYVIATSTTGRAMIDGITYKALASTEDTRGEVGADSVCPFNKENPYQFNIYRMQTSAGTYDQVQQINEPQLSVIKTGSVENDVFKYVYSSHTITAKTSLKLHYKTFGVNDQTYPIRLADMTARTLSANETFTIPFGGYNGAASFTVVEV